MSAHQLQILNLLSDGRIDVTQAERLLAAAASRPRVWEWLPAVAVFVMLGVQHLAACRSAFQWLALRAVEMSNYGYFHLIVNR